MTKPARIHSDVPSLRAFTLVELLIVISVIAILIAIVLASSKGVVVRQKERATRGVLVALDRALDEYKIATGTFPPYNGATDGPYDKVPGPDNRPIIFPKASGGDGKAHPARPDAAVFVKQVQGFGEVDAVFQGLASRFMRVTSANNLDEKQRDLTPSIVDAWAEESWPAPEDPTKPFQIRAQQVIYYVHPENVLAQALYGQCANGRPYFMSAGADKQYGLGGDPLGGKLDQEADEDYQARLESYVKDNVYSYKEVGAPNTSKQFFEDIRSQSSL